MERYTAMYTAAVLLGTGAAGGLIMALIRFSGASRPPSSLAMAHGLLGAAGLTLLIYTWAVLGISSLAQLATVILAIAAAGGTYINLRYHSRVQPLSIPWVLTHAAIAIVGFIFLLFAVSRTHSA